MKFPSQRARAALFLCVTSLAPTLYAAQQIPLADLSYADVADLALPSEIVANIRISDAHEVRGQTGAPNFALAQTPFAYFTIQGDIESLIKGPNDMPKHVTYLARVPLDARGKAPHLKKSLQIIFARRIPNTDEFIRLNAPDGAINWSQSTESGIRAILNEAAKIDSPKPVIGIESAFSVAGTVQGERETQIFLSTKARPVSLTIQRTLGTTPFWSIAFGEIVDHPVPPPTPHTLAWYQLACKMPQSVPNDRMTVQTDDQRAAIQEDYALVIKALGTCQRLRAH